MKWKIDGAEDLPLAIIEDTEDGMGIVELGERSPENMGIAKRIVTCVNNHDELLKMLREAVERCEMNNCEGEEDEFIEMFEATIAKAEGNT